MASASLAVGLIDTDILIDAERGHPDAIAFVTAQQAASGVRVSAVSAMELIVGSRNTFELTQVRRFLAREEHWNSYVVDHITVLRRFSRTLNLPISHPMVFGRPCVFPRF